MPKRFKSVRTGGTRAAIRDVHVYDNPTTFSRLSLLTQICAVSVRLTIMPVTFINRYKQNFRPSDELNTINAHHAHIRHERKRKPAIEAGRAQNAQVLSIRALVTKGRLGMQFVGYFQTFFDWYVASPTISGPHDSMTELGHEILSVPGLTFRERLLVVAIQAYIKWLERKIRE